MAGSFELKFSNGVYNESRRAKKVIENIDKNSSLLRNGSESKLWQLTNSMSHG